ncbi:hypothetical protein A0H81_00270 [Grifola frondosa]|uniref:Uncharacterized protein n=1 Tax=Grifola frondosa TaxID=5627 RepID=A0A1C7MQP4_GRIFR|nr:hypothetical protein A0H81_00270 [Grifola frondosa]
MALHGVDGAFLQRFAGQTDLETGNEGIRKLRDEVGDRVKEAAEKEGRVFAIMYDVSGVAPDRIQGVIERDWIHLIRDKCILDSPNYLREKGKAVVALWGFGFSDSHHDPSKIRAITTFIRNNTPGGAYIMAGVPAHWRTSVMDADSNPEFVKLWLEEFDAISPWTIGRYSNIDEADKFEQEKIRDDVKLIEERNKQWERNPHTSRKLDYIPVIFPGGSANGAGMISLDKAGISCGDSYLMCAVMVSVSFMVQCGMSMTKELHTCQSFRISDNYLFWMENYNFMALDEDDFDLPSDWFMRICGFAAEGLRGERIIHETFPSKELQDYWSTRPRYEDKVVDQIASGSDSNKGQSFADWEKSDKHKDEKDELPPPPYSLEVQELEPPAVPFERRPTVSISDSRVESSGSTGPPIPLANRPSISVSTSLSTTASPPLSPVPPVNSSSRPRLPSTSSKPSASAGPISPQGPARSTSPYSVATLTDNLTRQSISSPGSPSRPMAPSLHSTRPVSQGPSLPNRFYDMSASPARGFSHTLMPSPGHVNVPAPGPWSQAPWPPPEWGTSEPHRAYSPAMPPSSYGTHPHGSHHSHGHEHASPYSPGYLSSEPPPPYEPLNTGYYPTSTPSAPYNGDGYYSYPQPYSPYPSRSDSSGPFQFPEARPGMNGPDIYSQPYAPYNGFPPIDPEQSSSPPPNPSLYPPSLGPRPPPPPRPYGSSSPFPPPPPRPINMSGSSPGGLRRSLRVLLGRR